MGSFLGWLKSLDHIEGGSHIPFGSYHNIQIIFRLPINDMLLT